MNYHRIMERRNKPFKKIIPRGYLFRCGKCGKTFSDAMDLNVGTREWIAQCPHCYWGLPCKRNEDAKS